MKTLLLIIPTCAAMLFMSSCAAPFVPFPLSLVTSPVGYPPSHGRFSSSSGGGIDQVTQDAIDQSNRQNADFALQQSLATEDAINAQNNLDQQNDLNTENMVNQENAAAAAAAMQP